MPRSARRPTIHRRPASARRRRRGSGASPTASSRLLGWAVALGAGLVVTLVVTIGISALAANIGGPGADALGRARAAGSSGSQSVTCPAATPLQVGEVKVTAGPVAGYCQDRLINAAHIINAARALGIGTHTQAVAVMTAMGESSLVNIDHGDAAGPDSRGVFQQRDNGAWGTYAERMDPYTAATHFYEKLIKVPGWQTMQPTLLAHAVQINADPNHYASYWPAAVAVVEQLSGTVPY